MELPTMIASLCARAIKDFLKMLVGKRVVD